MHVHARSAPSSPEAAAKGNDTPIEANHLYSDVMKAKDSAPSRVSNVSPDSRNFSSEYPDGQRSSEAIIIAGELAAIRSSIKGLPGSALTSVYSTPVPTEGENNGDDRVGWTTVMRKSHHGSPVSQESLTKKSHHDSQTKESVSKCQLCWK